MEKFALDLGRAKLNHRGDRYYACMTIPPELREAFGDQKPLRIVAGTSERRIAEQRLFELETELRERIFRAAQVQQLRESTSAYQTAV